MNESGVCWPMQEWEGVAASKGLLVFSANLDAGKIPLD
jgi:hypothetical protein